MASGVLTNRTTDRPRDADVELEAESAGCHGRSCQEREPDGSSCPDLVLVEANLGELPGEPDDQSAEATVGDDQVAAPAENQDR